MGYPQETLDSLEIVDSIDIIEFDADAGLFRAGYDGNRDSTSLAVVAVVAAAGRSDPRELVPLHSAIDTGALDDLFSASTTERRVRRVSFPYDGFDVTVYDEGTIEVDAAETA